MIKIIGKVFSFKFSIDKYKIIIMSLTSKIIVGTLAGIAVGVAVGILLAPDKGSETRRKISEKYNDFSEELKDKITDLVDTVKDEYGNVRDKANDLVKKVSGKASASMKGEPRDSYTS